MAQEKTESKGVILILAVIIISAVLAAASAFAAIIISEIKISRLVDQSMQAFYLAESGAERALYQSRRRQAVDNCDILDVTNSFCGKNNGWCSGTNPVNSVSCINDSTPDAVSQSAGWPGEWALNISHESETNVFLQPNGSVQLDLFNPYQANAAGQTEAFMVTGLDNYWLYGELVNLNFITNPAGTIDCPQSIPAKPATSKGIILLDQNGTSPYLTGLFLNTQSNQPTQEISSGCSYILRINNNLAGTLLPGNFTIKVYTYDDAALAYKQIDIPSRLIIDSQATYGKSFQKIQVRAPIRPPLSGLYDFVLFSEQEVKK
jgi:hypothetical protein